MSSNWRTNLGGAVSTFGTALVGVGLVPQLVGAPSKVLTYLCVAGFVCEALGKSLTALFAADARVVNCLREQVNQNTQDVSDLKGNTPAPILKP